MIEKIEEIEKMKREIKEYIKTLEMPFSVQDIAKRFNIAWNTAKALLLELALEGEIKATKTTKSYVFTLSRGEKDE